MFRCDHIPIYNYVSSVEKPITWENYMALSQANGVKTPTVKAIYYYTLTLNRNYYLNLLYMFFLHLIPALLIDAAMVIACKKPR